RHRRAPLPCITVARCSPSSARRRSLPALRPLLLGLLAAALLPRRRHLRASPARLGEPDGDRLFAALHLLLRAPRAQLAALSLVQRLPHLARSRLAVSTPLLLRLLLGLLPGSAHSSTSMSRGTTACSRRQRPYGTQAARVEQALRFDSRARA